MIFAAMTLFAVSAFSQEIGDKVYKEVEVNGEKLFKWLKYSYLTEYDINGNMIHKKWSDGDELWYEYDSNGNKIHEKWSDGDEWWYEYDSN